MNICDISQLNYFQFLTLFSLNCFQNKYETEPFQMEQVMECEGKILIFLIISRAKSSTSPIGYLWWQ